MAESLDLKAFLADKNTFKTIRHWEDTTAQIKSADLYYDVSGARKYWTRKQFRWLFRHSPVKEKLKVHKELNRLYPASKRLTRTDINIIDRVYNTAHVSKQRFRRAILGLPRKSVRKLLAHAKRTTVKLVDLMVQGYRERFPNSSGLAREDALAVLCHFRKLVGWGSIDDAFFEAADTGLAPVWIVDALAKGFMRRMNGKSRSRTQAQRSATFTSQDAAQKVDGYIQNKISKRSAAGDSNTASTSSHRSRKHKRQHKRQKIREEKAARRDAVVSLWDVSAEPLTGVSKSNSTHLPSPCSSPVHVYTSTDNPSPNLKESPHQYVETQNITKNLSFGRMAYSEARTTFEEVMQQASETSENMSALAHNLDEMSFEPMPGLQVSSDEDFTVSPVDVTEDDDINEDRMRHLETIRDDLSTSESQKKKRKASSEDEEEDYDTSLRKKLKLAKRNARIAAKETISKYFAEENKLPVHSPKKSPKKKSSEVSKRIPAGTSCIAFPPLTNRTFGLVQEQLADDPFQLMIAVTFLNKTKGSSSMPVFFELMSKYPTPEKLTNADPEIVLDMIQHLGLQNQRTQRLIEISQRWLESPPAKGQRFRTLHYPKSGDGADLKSTDVLDDKDERDGAYEIGGFPGVGRYALDSWRIFCRDVLRGLAAGYNGEGAEDGFEPEWKRVIPTDKELRAYLGWMWLREGWIWDPMTGDKEVATPDILRKIEQEDHMFGAEGLVSLAED